MKNILSKICFVLCTVYGIAQNPTVRNVGDFTVVKVYDRVVVNLIKSEEQKVVITGRDADQVVVENKNGTLKVKMEFDRIFDGNNTFVEVHYTTLDVIDGNEGAEITVNELLEQERIEIRTQEGAKVVAGLQVDRAELRAVTGGIIETRGAARRQNVTVNTGGIYEGRRFETKDGTVLLQAGGEVEIYTSESIEVKIRAGGDVRVYGNPSSIKKNRVFGGRIEIIK